MPDDLAAPSVAPRANTAHWVGRYASLRPRHEEFTLELVKLIRALLRAQQVDFHLIESRTKDVQSFTEKITRASKEYTDPLTQITDLSGIRIIAYYDEDVALISQLLESEFDIDWSNSSDKRAALKPEEFGYRSVHYVAKLNVDRTRLREWQNVANLQAEIQVRTVLQHAWAAISHKLQYKREADVPPTLRRRLNRLSALLELADEQFLAIRNDTVDLTQVIEEKLATGETDLDVNLLTVEEFVRTSDVVRWLFAVAEEVGFDSLSNEDPDNLSVLAGLAGHLDLKSITELRAALSVPDEWALEYLRDQFMVDQESWQVDATFVCILILIGRSPNRVSAEYFV
ncbi:MAG TPA: hypothetical protein VLK84_06415, partial [Longimicrobium sp.]|nr:hypothetical protein [Longimicrobium sp.]